MKKMTLFSVAFAAIALVSSSASADPWSHGRLHDDLEHRDYHRELEHRDAHRYPMSWQQHGGLHDGLDHEAYHDRVDHRSYHRGAYGGWQGGYRGYGYGGYGYGTSGYAYPQPSSFGVFTPRFYFQGIR